MTIPGLVLPAAGRAMHEEITAWSAEQAGNASPGTMHFVTHFMTLPQLLLDWHPKPLPGWFVAPIFRRNVLVQTGICMILPENRCHRVPV